MNWSLPIRTAYRLGRVRNAEQSERRQIIELSDAGTFAALGTAGMIVRCLRGTLWITQTGMPGDIVLAAGETFTAMHRGKIVVTAFESAVMEIRR